MFRRISKKNLHPSLPPTTNSFTIAKLGTKGVAG
jgi:hypothetical protein